MKDYIEQAIRTRSNEFYGELVSVQKLSSVIDHISYHCNELDRIKKAIFYGKSSGAPIVGPTMKDYRDSVGMTTHGEHFMHGIIGIATEAGELLDAWNNADEAGVDYTNVREELGDVLWYIAITAESLGTSIEEIMERNIAKLRVRFPEKFESEQAIERDLNAERKELEK